MANLSAFVEANWVGIVVGVLGSIVFAALGRIAQFLFKFIRAYGLRKLGDALRESIVHLSAFKTLSADPVAASAYLTHHIARLILAATLCIVSFVVLCSALPFPDWFRDIFAIAATWFSFGIAKRVFAITAFYGTTAEPIIEESKKTNPLLKIWDSRPKGVPFIQLGKQEPKAVTPGPAPPPPPPANVQTLEAPTQIVEGKPG